MADYRSIITAQKAALEDLYRSLRQSGFGFEFPDEAFMPPSDRTDELLTLFAQNACPLPAAVAEFYRQIGGINFIGWSSSWTDDEYPDALNIMSLEQVAVDFEEIYLSDATYRAEMLAEEGGYYFPIAPDFFHKQNISGGSPYGFIAPNRDADPKLLGMPWELRFTEYLDFALQKDGFPGIDFLKHRVGLG